MRDWLTDPIHGTHGDYDRATQSIIRGHALECLQAGMCAPPAACSGAGGDSATADLVKELVARSRGSADQIRLLIAARAAGTHAASVPMAAWPA